MRDMQMAMLLLTWALMVSAGRGHLLLLQSVELTDRFGDSTEVLDTIGQVKMVFVVPRDKCVGVMSYKTDKNAAVDHTINCQNNTCVVVLNASEVASFDVTSGPHKFVCGQQEVPAPNFRVWKNRSDILVNVDTICTVPDPEMCVFFDTTCTRRPGAIASAFLTRNRRCSRNEAMMIANLMMAEHPMSYSLLYSKLKCPYTPLDPDFGIRYDNKLLHYQEIIRLEHSKRVSLYVAETSPYVNSECECRFLGLDGVLGTFRCKSRKDEQFINIPDVVFERTIIFKMVCECFISEQYAKLVVIFYHIIHQPYLTQDSNGFRANMFGYNRGGFTFVYLWKSSSDGKVNVTTEPVFVPDKKVTYSCTVKVSLSLCIPRTRIDVTTDSYWIKPIDPPVPNKDRLNWVIMGSLVGAGMILGMGLVSIIVFIQRRNETHEISRISRIVKELQLTMPNFNKKRIQKSRLWIQQLQMLQQRELHELKPNDVLKALLNDPINTMDIIQLKKETARIMRMKKGFRRRNRIVRNDQAEIVQYLLGIADGALERDEIGQGMMLTVKGCRCEKVQVRSDTQLLLNGKTDPRVLNMNVIPDYYNNKVMLAQAPLEPQFADHWTAIWQERVGLIIWIGSFVELDIPKMEPYIPLIEGETSVYGTVTVQTTMAMKIPGEYDAYRIQAVQQITHESREMTLLHVHMWPDHNLPKHPAYLADLVWQIQEHQLRQTKLGLPSIMLHCSIGVQRSPALLTVYIGRQMWLANKKVNIYGIMRYIRRRRFKAFHMGDPFSQVQAIYGVMQIIATRTQMEGINLLDFNPGEQAVFRPRMKSVSDSSITPKRK